MPTYSYACTHCSHDFDKFASMADNRLALSERCPNCSQLGGITQTIKATGIGRTDPFRQMNGDHKYIMKMMKKRHNNGKNTIPDY